MRAHTHTCTYVLHMTMGRVQVLVSCGPPPYPSLCMSFLLSPVSPVAMEIMTGQILTRGDLLCALQCYTATPLTTHFRWHGCLLCEYTVNKLCQSSYMSCDVM